MQKASLLLFILIGVTSFGCGGKGDSSKGAAASKEKESPSGKPKIALVMKSLANEFFSTMAEGAKSHQASHADQYELLVNGIKDERDVTGQVKIVEEMASSGVKALVIAPADSKALVPALRRAQAAGIVVINIDNRLDADVLKAENVTIPFVGPDNRTGAKKVGEYLASQLKEGDSVAILEGIRTSFNAQQRKAGFEDAMKAAKIEVVDSQSAQWEMSQASTIAAAMIGEKKGLKAILAANDSMALGALAALKSTGKEGEILIVGFDNITAVQQAIREKKILATADQHGDQLAVFGIEFALKLLSDKSQKIEDRETPVDLITSGSVQR